MKKQNITMIMLLLSGAVTHITAMEQIPETAAQRRPRRRRRRPTTPAQAQMCRDLSRQTARLKAKQQQLLLSAIFLAHRTGTQTPPYLQTYHHRTMPACELRATSQLSTTRFTTRRHRLYQRRRLPALLEGQWMRIQENVKADRRVNRVFMKTTAEQFNTVEFYQILYGQYAPHNRNHRFIPGDPHRTTLPARLR